MPFSQSSVSDVTCSPRNGDLLVAWSSAAPPGTWYQVYVDRKLAWHGTARRVALPHPAGRVRVEVGTVSPAEAAGAVNLAASLPAVPGGGSRVTVSWLGGSFLGHAGYRVYAGTTPGGAVSFARPAAVIPAYAQGLVNDGFGTGPFGQGGFGRAAGTYSWTSGPLGAGAWNVAVKPVDAAGNEGTAATWAVTVAGPPRPVPRGPSGRRLAFEVKRGTPGGYGTGGFGGGGFGTGAGFGSGGFGDGGFGVGAGEGLPYVTLSWLASPGV